MRGLGSGPRNTSRLMPVFLSTLLLLPFLGAANKSLVIEEFQAEIFVRPNGSIDVTETIRPRFTGSWNGIYRTIPVEYRTPQGLNYSLLLDLEGVSDEQGRALRYETSRERHYRKLKISIPNAANTQRTVVIHYRVRNALRFFDQQDENFSDPHDELYWNVTGDEWDVPINKAIAYLHMPPGVSGLRAVAFTGPYLSAEKAAPVEVSGADVTVATVGPLRFHEGLTVAAGWDTGIIERPGVWQRAGLVIRSNWALLIPIAVLIGMIQLWRSRGRDPRREAIAVQYEPPADLTPAEVGTLVDNSSDMRDVVATLVDLAVRGFLTVEEKNEKHLLGLWSRQDYVFEMKKQSPEWESLQRHERQFLASLFGGGEHPSIKLSELQNKFYKDLPVIRDRIYERLVERGYYSRRPDKVKHFYTLAGAGLGLVVAWLGSSISDAMGIATTAAILSGILTAAVVIGIGRVMPARTVRGARAMEEVLGFEKFLEQVEADRFERVIRTPQLFEKYLPFAMALGVEKRWAEAFAEICREPPSWYRGSDFRTFHSGSFVNSVNRMSNQTSSAMTSAPRSSGGSGFSGGSSGGGFGGGGGGGF